MSDLAALKTKLWDQVNRFVETREESTEAAEQLKETIEAISPLSPVPDPMNQEDKVEGHWVGVFQHFGAQHSKGMMPPAPSSLKIQTFGHLPDVSVTHLATAQEIKAADKSYNNVTLVENADKTKQAHCIIFGTYSADDEDPTRFHVAFSGFALRGLNGESDDALRAAFGLNADTALEGEFKPPRLHSDVVYLDDDTRVNYGGLGGVYVMRLEKDHPGVSVSFP